MSPQEIAEGKSHGNGEIKNGENPASLLLGKQIGNECGRDRDERRFADSHQGMANQQFSVVVRNSCQQRQSAPKDRT